MIKGFLWYNQQQERYGIVGADDTWEYDGLHCGACFDAKINNKWVSVRLEYSNTENHRDTHGWYLVGTKRKPDGLDVRM